MVATKQKVKTTTIGKYLLDRLYALGVEHIFGVPGDYILRLDKMIEESPLKFINTTRENTAGYAADAYARIRGLGVAVITYGVGMSIVNSLSQAYVESSPLVVISGTAGTDECEDNLLLHHLINKSHTTHADTTQLEIFKNVTIDQGVLDDPTTAALTIDRVLDVCLKYKKPVYLELPRNMVDVVIDLPAVPHEFTHRHSDQKSLQEALEEVKGLLTKCKHPLIWAGHEILRYGLSKPLLEFAEKHQIPIVSSMLGKTVIDENHPLFAGVYQGGMSPKSVIDLVENCDFALIFGVILNDMDTGFFTAKLDQDHRVIATASNLQIGQHHFHDVNFNDFINDLAKVSVKVSHKPIHKSRKESISNNFKPITGANTTTKRVFECIQSHIKPEHFITTDVGDCLFGSADLVLPWNSFIACAFFASLGFGAPAAIGAQIALPKRRVISIVGDGGFQMTSMELSAAVRYHLDPIVIVLNNHGYGTERVLLEGGYNDIVNWKYSEIPRVLGGGVGIRVTTEDEFENAMKKALADKGTFYLIEVELGKLDFSPGLVRLGELLGNVVKQNNK